MLSFYFSPFGRISRKGFWLGFIVPYFAVGTVLMLAFVSMLPNGHENDPTFMASLIAERLIWMSPVIFVVCWASFVTFLKRLHDRNISGFWLVPMFVFGIVGNGLGYFNPELFHKLNLLFIGIGLLAFIINIWLFVNAYFLRGTRGENTFGPDPRGTE